MPRKTSGGGGDAGALGEITNHGAAAATHAKGAPDLVLWNESARTVRFVEVKCPHWDRPSAEQLKFLGAAEEQGVATSIAEWEFVE